MKSFVLYLCFVACTTIVHSKDELEEKTSQRTKRQVMNLYYGGGQQSYKQMYDVNECGYVSSSSSSSGDSVNTGNFVTYNSFPVNEKVIHINASELEEVTSLAKTIFDGKCNKEGVLATLGVGKVRDGCSVDPNVVTASKGANLVEVIYDILAHRYKVNRFDVVRFTTDNPLPSSVCTPLSATSGVTELDRLLPPYCVLDDSKALRNLPTARSLSLLFEEHYDGASLSACTNLFGYFLFQAFSHDVQKVTNKTSCGNHCTSFTGCTQDNKIALVDNLRTDSVDVLHVCPADPFYSFYGTSCLTYRKLQNYNSDCQIRKRAPLNRATPYIDLGHIYAGVTTAANGAYPKNGLLPDFKDGRTCQSTPLKISHILKVKSHDTIAQLIKSSTSSLSDPQVFEYAKKANIYIFQRVLYEHVLPSLLGPTATEHYSIASTESCYDPSNVLQVPVETVLIALRYCHDYIPKEYQLLASNYELFDTQRLETVLSDVSVDQFYKHLLRGLFAKKLQREPNKCAKANYYAKPNTGYTEDIRSLDIQNGRDSCVEPYVQYLASVYNVSSFGNWDSYKMFFSGNQIELLSCLYKNPQDLELAVGGSLDNHNESIFGELFKIFISQFFSALKCSDSKFWSNALSGAHKEFIGSLDVQDWIACVSGLDKRPVNLFAPYDATNPLVDVTCKSRDAFSAYLSKYSTANKK